MAGLMSLLTNSEVEMINNSGLAGVQHPAWSVLNENSNLRYDRAPRDWLANQAIDRILLEEGAKNWLARLKYRILQPKGIDGTTSALAEIRCYGAMLDAGFNIRSVDTIKNKSTPDFSLEIEGQSFVVEVATKAEDDSQMKIASDIAAGLTPIGVERSRLENDHIRAEFTVSVVAPFGAPNPSKQHDSVQANAISRICAMKQHELQVAEGNGALLWLDFRDMGGWPSILRLTDTKPLQKGRGSEAATSGPFWYAFYGWLGAPIFEEESFGRMSTYPMQHHGRFSRPAPENSRFSAAVICLANSTLVFENPYCSVPLNWRMRTMLSRLPLFDLEHSVIDLRSPDVIFSIAQARTEILRFEASSRDR